MRRRLASRLIHMFIVLLLVSFGVSLMVELVPGDAASVAAGPDATPQTYAAVRHALGLDRPVLQRYVHWLGRAVHGDLGRTLVPPVEEVSARLARAVVINVEIMIIAVLMALIIALPLGMISAYRADGRFDRTVSGVNFGLLSMPPFVTGIVILLVLAFGLKVAPPGLWVRPTDGGVYENLRHAFAPSLTLALALAAQWVRLLRNDMISTLNEDYIVSARARGMSTYHIVFRESLRPSSFSLVTLAGLNIANLLGGAIVVEQLFALPGLGSVVAQGAAQHDFPLVQGAVLLVVVVFVVINLVVDLLYEYLDPRLRRAER